MEYQETPSKQQRESIYRLVGEFETAYRAGQRPEIERFLADNSGLRKYLLRELIALEIQLRRSSGKPPTVDEYRQRFPEDGSLIEAIFLPATEMVSTVDQSLHPDVVQQSLPKKLGRYVIQRLLGKGGFGVVYLAHDPQLDRFVALKIPRRERFTTVEQVASFIQEARTAAKLKHPGLVAVHDVQEHAGLPYIVQEYIDGDNLAVWSATHQPSFEQIAKILIGITEALSYAHQQRLTHCDLKLANVLMDQQGKPYVADFGLAVHESVRASRKGSRFGTPSMMAPEQVRGEGHRLDGRTDIWALGVMLYELLVSQKPFAANSHDELFNEIETLDPRPPRQIDRHVPRELERICLKCLQKRRTERYNTADDLHEDLQAWLAQEISTEVPQSSTVVARDSSSTRPVPDSSTKAPLKIIPKGLRSFDAGDADFFLDLLPGPRDRDGLPGSIRFWKHRIEEIDADKTFAVGLIYGPSGCGKSSLVKAGLIPQLSDTVLPIYVEATAADTEVRILKQLHKQLPRLAADLSLPGACAELRQTGAGRHRKLLIVIDQFEQWLHAHPELKQTQLVDALRQCEGGRLQTLLLVRDDFFASVHRLFQELEDPLLEGSNYALVDRFDKQHSRKVLAAFGQAYGNFEEKLSDVQQQFVLQAVEQLAEDEKVISVRLSLFADMLKSRPWTLASLQEIGGVSGVGVTFLEETFSVKTASPSHRVHEQAIRQVLRALLPAGSDIKGAMRSESSLQEAAGYQSEPSRFEEVLRILDQELRIITPTEPEGEKFEVRSEKFEKGTSNFYQLTHDYLVPSLREWLTRKQRETRKGRAELKLAERAATWNTERENKQLPSVGEWLNIRLLTHKQHWTKSQRTMMRRAARVHANLGGGVMLTVLLVGLGIYLWDSPRSWKNWQEQTRAAAESLQNNLGPTVPVNIRELRRLPSTLVRTELQTRFASATNARHKLSLAFALADYAELDAGYLVSRIDDIAVDDTGNYLTALKTNPPSALVALKAEALKCIDKPLWRRKAKLAIAALGLKDAELALDVCTFENRPDPEQRTLFIDEFAKWDIELKVAFDAVKHSDSPALRSGMCLAVGQIPLEKIIDADKESCQSVALKWFVEQADGSTHSAAGWLLRHWKLPLPVIPQPHEITPQRDWFVVKTSLANMLRIRPTIEVFSGIQHEFWVGDREVTLGQFEQFMNDANYAATEKAAGWDIGPQSFIPTAEHPAQGVGWYDAVLYCNWLSLREGLKPCYERTGTKEKGYDEKSEHDAWRMIPGATGYRLLHDAEWEYACRAGTSTQFSSGNDDTLLSGYCQMYPSTEPAQCGEKLPNAWGLHDVHGNVAEWCSDLYDASHLDSRRVFRGGDWSDGPTACRSASRYGTPSYRSNEFGFRLALSTVAGAGREQGKEK